MILRFEIIISIITTSIWGTDIITIISSDVIDVLIYKSKWLNDLIQVFS
jgi:hypothetical protein